MDYRFWMATFSTAGASGPPSASARLRGPESRGRPGSTALTIEVIEQATTGSRQASEQKPPPLIVLLSRPTQGSPVSELECRIGFCNDTGLADEFRDNGFPVVDAQIGLQGGVLEVIVPYFADAAQPAMCLGQPLLKLSGVVLEAAAGTTDPVQTWASVRRTRYQQATVAPDPADPDRELIASPRWQDFIRRNVVAVDRRTVKVEVTPARFPDLTPLSAPDLRVNGAAQGFFERESPQPSATQASAGTQFRKRPRSELFVAPAFRFDEVESVGFRIDLGAFGARADACLEQLVAPLNFHLDAGAVRAGNALDFRYRAASRTVIIELLRYGRMRLDDAEAPLSADDYQCQHELLLRVLVGRVDDDTAQARDPAVFVPAIFVDNPWSRVLGREVQGFDKRLACFRTAKGPLRSDGRHATAAVAAGHFDEDPQPLSSVSRIDLVSRVDGGPAATLLDLECQPARDLRRADFNDIDLHLALGPSALLGTSWRQSDFNTAEFRRSFARSQFSASALGFRSIQVSPVGKRALPKTWITGQFTLDRVKVARPAGWARLGLHDLAAAPPAWRMLCKLLGGSPQTAARVECRSGDWYRLLCSTRMTIDNGLDW